MLARPEIGSREHILSWLASKPVDESYEWLSATCPCNQYGDKFDARDETPDVLQVNRLAHAQPQTFGALYERARKAWG
jgi:hypothetical protein